MRSRSAAGTRSEGATPAAPPREDGPGAPVHLGESWPRIVSGATPESLGGAGTGIRAVVVAGGPAGLRGEPFDSAIQAWTLPVPSAVAAAWDPDLAERLGRALGVRARRLGADVVIAPLANLQRTPSDGRHGALLSEDPVLAGSLAAALVRGIQAGGVAACVAHFPVRAGGSRPAAAVAQVGERTLREVHLAPFEESVRAGAWAVLVAGLAIDDGVEVAPAVAHRRVLGVLTDDWAFDGLILADGLTPCPPGPALTAGVDALLPGPRAAWGPDLLATLPTGCVPPGRATDAAVRVLRLAERVGAIDDDARPRLQRGGAPPVARPAQTLADLRRLAAASAVVVLKDDDRQVPREPERLLSVAVVGRETEALAEGLRSALPGAWVGSFCVEVDHVWGRRAWPPAVASEADLPVVATDPQTGRPGVRIQTIDASGAVVESWLAGAGWDGWIRTRHPDAVAARVAADVALHDAGGHWVGAETLGAHRVTIDGRVVSVSSDEADAQDLLGPDPAARRAHAGFPRGRVPLDVAGTGITVLDPHRARVEVEAQTVDLGPLGRFGRVLLRHQAPGPGLEQQLAAAERAAVQADLAVVVVRGDHELGGERTTLGLPGRQDELVERILAVRRDAVVVVAAGAPSLLPWLAQARTVLWAWPPGPGWGDGLADALLGRAEPAGRLPWTLPARIADVPVQQATPDPDGAVPFLEGLHVGYRSWELSGRVPAAPFGHGLGWTEWAYEAVEVIDGPADDDGARPGPTGGIAVAVTVRNVGARTGREVVQAYLEVVPDGAGDGPAAPGDLERPVRWLAGFAAGRAEPGEVVTVRVPVARRAFEVWDVASREWMTPTGRYRLRIGRSVRDLRLAVDLER